MLATDTPTQPWLEPLATWCAQLDGNALPKEVGARLRDSVLDWWGALIAGTAHPLASLYRQAFVDPAPGACSVAGSPEGQSAQVAASSNAAISHLQEVDDGHRMAMMHPAATVVPVVMALGEALDLPGPTLRAAIVAGYEAGLRVGTLLGRAHYATCHTTGTAGCFGAAAAAARAMDLDPQHTLWAFGHAGTQAAGLWQFLDDGAETAKAFHAATAVRNGLAAARLAAEGIPGAGHILEGRRAMLAAWGLSGDPSILSEGLGEHYEIQRTTLKGWPTCGQMHSSLDALRDLIRQQPPQGQHPAGEDIDRIVVSAPRVQLDIANLPNPKSLEEVRFSSRFCLALLAIDGDLTFAGLTPATLAREDVRDLAARVTITEDPAFTALFPAYRPARVQVVRRDGTTCTAERRFRRGDPEAPWSWPDLVTRFETLTTGTAAGVQNDIVAWCADLATAQPRQGASIRALFHPLREKASP